MTVEELLESIRGRRVYDLSREFHIGMPVFPGFPTFSLTPIRRHGDKVYEDGYTGSDELVTMCNHTGTNMDALCHGSVNGLMYGGKSFSQGPEGCDIHGVETIDPLVRRGVLLDVPLARGLSILDPAYEVTPSDLEAALGDSHLGHGDVALIRTGWIRYWDDLDRYSGAALPGLPGPGLPAAEWLSKKGIAAAGSDTIAFERYIPNQARVPVHRHFLVEKGIFILEALDLEELAADGVHEFLMIAAPIKFRGATGGPVRPLAMA